MIKTWSFSSLKTFEQCPRRIYLQKIEKIPEPQHPAAKRGTEIHEEAELYVRGEAPFTANLKKLQKSFERLNRLFSEDKVETEGDWGFTEDWEPCEWKAENIWARVKLDAYVKEDDTSATVIDYKTGRKYGNEITHNQQAMLYTIAAFMRNPEIEFINAELWYLDHGVKMEQAYTRRQAMLFFPRWIERAKKLTSCEVFKPKPSKQNCKWCHYKTSGDCEYGVD